MKNNSPITGILFALMGFGLFATHDAIIKSFAGGVGVFQIMLFSNLFALPWVSALVMSDGRHENFRPKRPFMIILRTLSGLAAGACAFFAFMRLPLADVYGLLFASPLLITLFAVPFLGERLGVARISAVIIGFIGVLIVLPIGSGTLDIGHLAAFCAAVFGSLNAIITRKIGGGERDAVMIMLPMMLSILVLALLLPFDYKPLEVLDLYKLLVIGAFAFGAQLCIVMAYKRADAGMIAPMQYSQLIWAVFYGFVFYDEGFSSRKAIGAAIIIASGLIILYRELRGPNSTNRPTSSVGNYRPGYLRGFRKTKESES